MHKNPCCLWTPLLSFAFFFGGEWGEEKCTLDSALSVLVIVK